jgi:hypothetical protein
MATINGETYFSVGEVFRIVMIALAGIAFIYSEGPVWGLQFWKDFIRNIVIYAGWTFFVFTVIVSFQSKKA